MSDGRFAGRRAWVVGGAGGMGAAIVERLRADGAEVRVTDLKGDAHVLDIRDGAAVQAWVTEYGPFDLAVVASGVFRASPFLDGDPALFQQLFDVNVLGVLHCLRAVAGPMSDAGVGAIVVIGSQSGKLVRQDQAAYGASKAAVSYAVKAIGLELAPKGVRLNVVLPGVTETPLARAVWDSGRGSAEAHVAGSLDRYRQPIPLRKVAQPADVAGAVCFLLSDDAAHITMSELLVDGGAHFIA